MIPRVWFALSALLVAFSVTAADTVKEAARLRRAGNPAEALARIDEHLARQPADREARFLRGVILTELKRPADAIETFTRLSTEYPEMPEPYNNLAVIYAAQGNYSLAKDQLELALRANPEYATAHENLGDLYLQFAAESYSKALQLDKKRTAAENKLALTKELIANVRKNDPR